MVYVISKNGKPLMPCENVIARLLLKEKKAKVKRREPFTIKLLVDTTEYTQNLTLGVDTGSGTAGFCVVNEKHETLYRSEVILRNDIKAKMDQRRKYRRTRRNRKTRYRKPRFLNRHNSKKKGRLSPTMVSKIHSHEKEINYIKSILPITTLVLENGHFNPAAMKDPRLYSEKVKHWGYQKGPNYGFENTRMRVLARDGYTCKLCGGKSNDSRLEVHHIIYRSKGGSDDADNLVTLCRPCHMGIHSGKINHNFTGKFKDHLKDATQMNVIRCQLMKIYPKAEETFGYVTSANRKALGYDKSTHWLDACIIATGGEQPFFRDPHVYCKKCISEGDKRQTKGVRSEKRIQTGKIDGFRRYDKVDYLGRKCFIKGRMSTGYAFLMDIKGNTLTDLYTPDGSKTPKLSNLKRIQARSSWIIDTQTPEIPKQHKSEENGEK